MKKSKLVQITGDLGRHPELLLGGLRADAVEELMHLRLLHRSWSSQLRRTPKTRAAIAYHRRHRQGWHDGIHQMHVRMAELEREIISKLVRQAEIALSCGRKPRPKKA
jgi:hypothetical protein